MEVHKCKISILLIFIILLLMGCGGGSSVSDPEHPSDANVPNGSSSPTTIQQALDNAVSVGVDGIFVYVDQTNKLNEGYSAGVQNKVLQQPADVNTLFKIASISKLFIAVSAVKIIDQEFLSLNNTLAEWLPELASRIVNSDTITIEHLIQHRSGIADFDSQTGFDWHNAHTDIDSTLLFALDKPADFHPNSKYEYSNTNYLLLAKILDKALGYSHQVFIAENILIPLGMYNTYLELSDIDSSLLAKGYWEDIDRSIQDYVIPGGSMISTIKDIAVFIRALNTGNLLSSSEKDIYASVYWFNHSGWLPGYQSVANYYSDIDAVVIQFVNTTGGSSENIANTSYEKILNIIRK